jgi:subtilase family serine protease
MRESGFRRTSPARLISLATTLTITAGAFIAAAAPASAAVSGAALRRLGPPPVIPKSAAFVGRTPASDTIHFDLVLTPRDPAGLQSFALAVSTPGSPDRGRFLTVRQFAARFGQTSSAIHAADGALREIGLKPGPAMANGLVIPVSTTVGQAAESLHTQFADYRLSSGRVAFANTSAPQLPASLGQLTTAVIGLNDLVTSAIRPTGDPAGGQNLSSSPAQSSQPAAPAACKAASKAASKTHGWTYPKLAAAYSINSLYKQKHFGAGTRIALFELDPWSGSDITSFQQCYHTKVKVSSVKVDGGGGKGAGQGEAALDIETAIALAPKAGITVYDAPGSNYPLSMVDELTKMFDDDSAQIVSMSYGLCESVVQSAAPGLVASENVLFEQAAAEGMSVFVASGDTGSEGCYRVSHSTSLAVLDPASQPFVTAVGGTDLQSAGSPPKERVWNEGVASGAGAGGGGISGDWAMPAWQSGPGVVNSYSSGTPCAASTGDCREVPDVSASADPDHGYIIRWTGKWIPIGGTSAAAPLWAAMLSDIESAHSPVYRAGFLNPLLYSAAATAATSFHDISAGNNDYTGSNSGAYPATTAYDMGSGLGSPKAAGLEADINAANSLIAFTDAPGTNSPPGHLGTFKMKAFGAPCTAGTNYGVISAPTGTISLSPQSECEQVGSGWATWSNGYSGDVYWQNANEGGSTTLTLTLPTGTRAFYFYAEPNEFETFDLQATAQNGTTSGPLQVYGDSGAQYYGFYANGKGENIRKITISCNDDFAVGEFGIAR